MGGMECHCTIGKESSSRIMEPLCIKQHSLIYKIQTSTLYLQGKIDQSVIILGDFNTLPSEIDKTSRH